MRDRRYGRWAADPLSAGDIYNMRQAEAKRYRAAGDIAAAQRVWAVIHCAAALRRRGKY